MCVLPDIELQLPSILASQTNDKEWQEISELVGAKCKLNDLTVMWPHSYFKLHTIRSSHQLSSWSIKWSTLVQPCSSTLQHFIDYLDEEGKEMYGVAEALEGRNKNQMMLQNWAQAHKIKHDRSKCKFPHLKNGKQMQKHRMKASGLAILVLKYLKSVIIAECRVWNSHKMRLQKGKWGFQVLQQNHSF